MTGVVLAGLIICLVFSFVRWRAHRHHLARQADYNRAIEEIERHWPGINDDGTTP